MEAQVKPGEFKSYLKLLLSMFSILTYEEEKLHIPAVKNILDPEGLEEFLQKLKRFFGEENGQNGVNYNVFTRGGIDIDRRLIENLTKEKFQEFLKLIKLECQKIREGFLFEEGLEKISGQVVNRVWRMKDDTGKEIRPAGYEVWWTKEGMADPISALAETLNQSAGQNLFSSYASKYDSDSLLLFISDENIRKFAALSNLEKCGEIFRSPRIACTEYLRGSFKGQVLCLVDRIIHPVARQELGRLPVNADIRKVFLPSNLNLRA